MMCFKKNAISVCGISCLVGKLMLQNRDQMSHEQMISYTNITHLCLMMGSERVNLSPDCRSSAQRIIEINSISHVSSLSISTRYMYIYIYGFASIISKFELSGHIYQDCMIRFESLIPCDSKEHDLNVDWRHCQKSVSSVSQAVNFMEGPMFTRIGQIHCVFIMCTTSIQKLEPKSLS